MVRLRSVISAVLMFSLLATGPTYVTRANVRSVDVAETKDDENGLQFRLSNGTGRSDARPATKPVAASNLSQSETENILKRLPPMKVDSTSAQEFALREGSLPPPRTGSTIEASFPVATAAPDPIPAGPLEVLRYSPEGAVPMAPELSITFSQPMVALTSQGEAGGAIAALSRGFS